MLSLSSNIGLGVAVEVDDCFGVVMFFKDNMKVLGELSRNGFPSATLDSIDDNNVNMMGTSFHFAALL